MTLLDDPNLIILDNGYVRTRDRNGNPFKATYKYKNYPIPSKSGDSDKSSDKSKD